MKQFLTEHFDAILTAIAGIVLSVLTYSNAKKSNKNNEQGNIIEREKLIWEESRQLYNQLETAFNKIEIDLEETKKKFKEYRKKTDKKIKELEDLNNKYKEKFGEIE